MEIHHLTILDQFTPLQHVSLITVSIFLNVYGSVHRKYIPVYIQQDATLHRLQINIPTDATNYYPLFLMFPLTLHVSGLYWSIIRGVLSYCYATIWFLSCLLAVRGGGLAVRQGHLHGRQETNGSITAAQDTPDDGPVKARNM
jgi:hypothetical protein